jgi:hypothetical protein
MGCGVLLEFIDVILLSLVPLLDERGQLVKGDSLLFLFGICYKV